jgi:hypothetical protein
VTRFYHWGPHDAWNLPLSRLRWWHEQMVRMIRAETAAATPPTS